MPKLTIKVTRHEIDAGKPCNRALCPVALAAAKAGIERAQVAAGVLMGYRNGRHFTAALPEVVDRWVSDLDNGFHAYPITFTVQVPA
jgi:hypothetical protein